MATNGNIEQEYLINGEWVGVSGLPQAFPALFELMGATDESGQKLAIARQATEELQRLLNHLPSRFMMEQRTPE